MPSPALADALKDFSSAPALASGPAPKRTVTVAQPSRVPPKPAAPPKPSVDELVATEVERAKAKLTEELKAEHAAALAEERERHAREMAEITENFGKEAAASMEARLAEMEARLVELTTSITARILGTGLSSEIRKRAVAQLAETIRAALADNEAVRIRVRGAPSMCEALLAALGSHRDQIDVLAGEGVDLSVTIEDSIYETRLSEWSSAMSELFE
jgi:hypothetical protein